MNGMSQPYANDVYVENDHFVWQVNIKVLDVDEPPIFSKPIYAFSVMEETMVTNIGTISAKDPDQANNKIR